MAGHYRFIYRRLLSIVPTLFLAVTLIFFLVNVAPGNTAEVLLGPGANQNDVAALEKELGLNLPLPTRYLNYLASLVTGNLGHSLASFQSVNFLIAQDFPITITLSAMAITIALAIGVPAGVISAMRRNTKTDVAASAAALSGVSIPGFWLGILLILFFSVDLRLLPATGPIYLFTNPGHALVRLLMPAIMLGVAPAGFISRMTRSAMIDVMSQDYVTTARAKGLSERVVVYRHALKNALVPVTTVAGFQFGGLLGGSIIAEEVFGLNGMGQLLFVSILNRDYPVVAGVSLVYVLVFLLVNVVVDVLYMYLDPKVRFD